MKEINDLMDMKKHVDSSIKRAFKTSPDVWTGFGLQIDRVRWAVRELEGRYKRLLKAGKG